LFNIEDDGGERQCRTTVFWWPRPASPDRPAPSRQGTFAGFTLIELLVVIAIIAMSQAYYKVGDRFTGPASDYNQFLSAGVPFVMRIAMIQAPASTVWVVDGGVPGIKQPIWKSYEFWWYDPAEINAAFPAPRGQAPRYFQNLVERHSDMVNVIYCDGHVKSVKLEQLIQRKTVAGQEIMTAFTIEDD
jgi:prepilin-type N-terminal cleavage/methylation domain-containing protein/prepilin-type processing-associated H-X9-DG protein